MRFEATDNGACLARSLVRAKRLAQASEVDQHCPGSGFINNPDYGVTMVDHSTVRNVGGAPTKAFSKLAILPIQLLPDCIRLDLPAHFGEVRVDATLFCRGPLRGLLGHQPNWGDHIVHVPYCRNKVLDTFFIRLQVPINFVGRWSLSLQAFMLTRARRFSRRFVTYGEIGLLRRHIDVEHSPLIEAKHKVLSNQQRHATLVSSGLERELA